MTLRHMGYGQGFGGAFVVLCLTGFSIPALGQNVSAAPPPGAEQPSPQQHVAAIKAAKAREDDYLSKLAMTVKSERRDDAWAQRTEADLRNSYTSAHLAAGGLKSVDCRTSKCDVQVLLKATRSVAAAVDQQRAITQWIASSTPCGYTMLSDQAPMATAASVMRIYLTCGK